MKRLLINKFSLKPWQWAVLIYVASTGFLLLVTMVLKGLIG